MKDNAARMRDAGEAQREKLVPGWADVQDSLGAASDLSILLVKGHQPPSLHISNNNSICHAFQSSEEHARLCDPYCGEAHERALSAGETNFYRCHAGLHCFAMPVEIGKSKRLAVIGGRAFLTSADYRALAERFRAGDLQELLSSDLFKNVIFASRQDLENLAERIKKAADEFDVKKPQTKTAARLEKETDGADVKSVETISSKVADGRESESETDGATKEESDHSAKLQERFFPPATSFQETCGVAVRNFAEKQELVSLALLLREKGTLHPVFSLGRFETEAVHVEIGAKDARLALTAKAGASLALSETSEGFKPLRTVIAQGPDAQEKTPELFPLVVGDEVKGALLVCDTALSDTKRRAISNFCRDIAMPIEVLRLRNELEQRARFADYLHNFSQRINSVSPADTYGSILRQSAELLHAGRSSLLLYDEVSKELALKAAVGHHDRLTGDVRISLGEGVAGTVLREGMPLVVRDMEATGHEPAPPERGYKTKSFISYPIMIGRRKVGVLNVTDKIGGGAYDDVDLSLIETIAPQMAMALDRACWHEKAAQFQLMSITDPLTGLQNRRYLEERLTEEINRSKRYGYAMSFMMIDIDDFKHYNDRNLHQAGDLALQMTAQCLKSALRAADIAARYGGEEFCILLPQTNLSEAAMIAERIRRRVERTRFSHGKSQPGGALTVSIGVSTFTPEHETAEEIIRAADRALYLAKGLGKNCVQPKEDVEPTKIDAADET